MEAVPQYTGHMCHGSRADDFCNQDFLGVVVSDSNVFTVEGDVCVDHSTKLTGFEVDGSGRIVKCPTLSPPPPPPPSNECHPSKTCNVCDKCCNEFIPDGEPCDKCVETDCTPVA